MPADRSKKIKGITVEIGGDTTKLESALKSVNGEIRNTQSQLKDVEKLLKLDPNNTELLAQKQRLLGNAVRETKEKLETLKHASEQAAKTAGNYDAWKAKYDPLRKEISETQDKLKLLKEQSKEADEQLANGEISKEKYDRLQAELKETQDQLKSLRQSAKDVSEEFGHPVSPEQYDALQREITETEQALKQLEKQAGQSSVALQKISQTGKTVEMVGDKISYVGKALTPATAAITGIGAASVKTAMDFEDSMAKVSTIADTTEVPLEDLKDGIVELSNETGIASAEIAQNVYDAISAGQETGDAVNFVANSTKLARAGFAEAGAALDVLTTILNAYGLEAGQVTDVSDMLIQTQNLGKTSVAELSAYMGKLIPTANSYGVKLDQICAGYATLTANGAKTAHSTTFMNAMLNELGKSGTTVSKVLREQTGKSFSELMASGFSLADCLSIVNTAAKDQGRSFNDMWSSSDAAKAALKLLDGDAEKFNATLKEMRESSGATDEAFKKLETTSYSLEKTANLIQNTAIDLGTVLLDALGPTIEAVCEKIEEFAEWFSSLDEGTKNMIVQIGLLVAVLGPILLVLGRVVVAVGNITTYLPQLAGSLESVKGAIAALSGPAGIVIAVVAALAAAFATLWKTNEEFREKMSAIWSQIVSRIQAFCQDISDRLDTLGNSFSALITLLETLWNGFCAFLAPIFEGTFSGIAAILDGALDVLTGLLDVFTGVFTGNWEQFLTGLLEIFGGVFGAITGALGAALDAIAGVIGTFLSWFGIEWEEGWTDAKDFVLDLIPDFMKDLARDLKKNGENVEDAAEDTADAIAGSMTGGLASGIKSRKGEVEEAGEELAETSLDAAKDALDDIPPSQEFVYLGQHAGEGMVIGMNDCIGPVSAAASEMAGAAVEAAKNGITAFSTWIEKRKYFNQITTAEELAGWQALQEQYVEGSEEREEIDRKIYRLQQQLIEETYQASVNWIEEQKYYNNLSLEEELAAWERVQARYMEGTEERKNADREVYRVKKELAGDAYQASVAWIEQEKYYGRLTAEEEIAAWQRVRDAHLDDAEIIMRCDREMYGLRKQLAEEAAEAEKKAAEERKKAVRESYNSEMERLDELKFYDQLTPEQELAELRAIREEYAEGSEERKKIDRQIYTLEKQLREEAVKAAEKAAEEEEKAQEEAIKAAEKAAKEAYNAAVERIDDLRFYDQLTTEQELAEWKKLQAQYVEGSEERKKIDRQVYTLEKQLREEAAQAEKEAAENREKEAKAAYDSAVEQMEDRKYFGQATLADELAFWQDIQSRYMEGTAERKQADKEVYRLEKEMAQDAYNFSVSWIENEKYYNRLSTEEEIAAWQRVRDAHLDDAEIIMRCDREIYALRKQLIDDAYEYSMAWISDELYYGRMSLIEELAAYKRVQSRYAIGTKERAKMDREVYRLEKEIYEARKKYIEDVRKVQEDADKDRLKLDQEYRKAVRKNYDDTMKDRLALENEYAGKVKAVREKLAEDINALEERYQDALQSRTDALFSAYGLFDEVTKKEEVSGATLMKNLKDQVQEFSDWHKVLGQLSARGLSQEFMEELQQMGPSSIAELKALNAMSDRELGRYAALWEIKHTQAREQARGELQGLRADTDSQIAQLHEDAKTELNSYLETWKSRMDEVNANASSNLATLKADFNKNLAELNANVGEKLVELRNAFALQIGLTEEDVDKQMREMSESAKQILREAGWDNIGQSISEEMTNGLLSGKQGFLDEISNMALQGVQIAQDVIGSLSGDGLAGKIGDSIIQTVRAGSKLSQTMESKTSNAGGNAILGAGRAAAGFLSGEVSQNITVDNSATAAEIQALRGDVAELGKSMKTMQVVLDNGVLIGQLEGPMDYALGRRAIDRARGI